MRKIFTGALIFFAVTLLPLSALAFDKLPEQISQVSNAQEAQELAKEISEMVEQRRATDPAYARKLARAEAIAAKAFAEKRLGDAALNIRGMDLENTEMTIQSSQSSVPWNLLWVGDVMHINNKKFLNIYSMYYSHSGIYNGNNTVYESVESGVRVLPISAWQQGQPVALGYTRNRSHSQVVAALNWAKNTYGTDGQTPYNWNYLNKTTDSALYCSQLVWKMHQYMGVNVDSNHWSYSLYLTARYGAVGTAFAYYAVAPDEIYLSDEIVYFFAS
ncbi:MAG: YiiX/YebB-like N1pC/P60 family cysteine hydrolase [Bacillota bacterium]